MTSGIWHCRFDGEQSGPFSDDELEYLVRRGQVTRETEMRREGTQTWIPAGKVPGLFPGRPTGVVQPTKPAAEVPPETPALAPPAPAPPAPPVANPPELPETAPPPIPKNDPPIIRGILAGAAALLVLLLLLALLFWHGDGGKGHAKGSGGNAAGAGAGSGSGSNEQPSTTSVPKPSEESTPTGKQAAGKPTDSQGGRRPESSEEGQGEPTAPASKDRSTPEENRKPTPERENAVVFDGADEAEDTDDDAGGSGSTGTFFGITTRGRKFVYIVDRSGSMAGGPFSRARDELIRSVKDLTEKQSFYVFFFSGGTTPMFKPPQNTMCRATPENIRRLEEWVDTVRCAGSTDPREALYRAISMKPDAIFLLSDGYIHWPISQLLQNWNRRRPAASGKSKQTQPTRSVLVTINTIGFQNTAGEPLLKQIAAENDGEYRFIPAPAAPQIPGLPGIPGLPELPNPPVLPLP